MFNLIEKIARDSKLVKSAFDTYRYNIQDDKNFITSTFKRRLGYKPDLQNPKTFNEKIQWLKLNSHSPLHTLCSDKIEVKEHVKSILGENYIIKTIFTGSNTEDINNEILSGQPCIIKTSHGSGGGIVIKSHADIDVTRIRKIISDQLKKNFYKIGREPQYRDIIPRFIVEELLSRPDGSVPYDFKIHCFNGRPEFIQVDIDRFSDHRRNIYDVDWAPLPFEWQYARGIEQERPEKLGQMLNVARQLAKPFIYSRIDLYEVSGNIYFGEITFHPGSGWEKFNPEQWDRTLGDRLHLE